MSLNLQKCQTNELLYISFNQDYTCFAVGTDSGFRIYNCEPFKETFSRPFATGGIGIVEMLFRCNILALVGGGRNPRYPTHKVMIWDDHQNRCIGELSFRREVKAVRLRRDRVIVALDNKVYVYNFADLSLLDHIETYDNPRGLVAVCPSPAHNVVACPGLQKGHVRVDLYHLSKTTLIAAHEAVLACIALNYDGSRLATASEKGTLIRVYDTISGELLQELRRGTEKAEIYSIAFNSTSSMLACTSDKGTVHIFKLRDSVHTAGPPLGPDASPFGGAPSSSTAAGTTPTGGGGGGGAPTVRSPVAAGASGTVAGVAGVHTGHTGGPAGGDHGSGMESGIGIGIGTGAVTGHGTASGMGGVAASMEDSRSLAGAGGAGSTAPSTSSTTTDSSRAGLGLLRGIVPKYFYSEWSYAQFRISETRSIVAFGHAPNTIIVLGADGSFFKANFEKGGEADRVVYSQFLHSTALTDVS